MKRIMVLLTVVAIVMVMLTMSASPAFAKGCAFLGPGFIHSEGKCFKDF